MNEAIYNESIVEIVTKKGGWSTIIDAKGNQKKVRNGELKPIGEWKQEGAKGMESATTAPSVEEKTEYSLAEAMAEDAGEIRKLPAGWHRIGKTEFDLSKYQSFRSVRTASGRPSIDVADQVATLLRGKSLEEVREIGAKVLQGETAESLRIKYEHLNPGMQRMNIGNRIRKVWTADV